MTLSSMLIEYSNMMDAKDQENRDLANKSYASATRNEVARTLSSDLGEADAAFFQAGFNGANPKFTSSGSINEASASAKAAYKAGKAARNTKEARALMVRLMPQVIAESRERVAEIAGKYVY